MKGCLSSEEGFQFLKGLRGGLDILYNPALVQDYNPLANLGDVDQVMTGDKRCHLALAE